MSVAWKWVNFPVPPVNVHTPLSPSGSTQRPNALLLPGPRGSRMTSGLGVAEATTVWLPPEGGFATTRLAEAPDPTGSCQMSPAAPTRLAAVISGSPTVQLQAALLGRRRMRRAFVPPRRPSFGATGGLEWRRLGGEIPRKRPDSLLSRPLLSTLAMPEGSRGPEFESRCPDRMNKQFAAFGPLPAWANSGPNDDRPRTKRAHPQGLPEPRQG